MLTQDTLDYHFSQLVWGHLSIPLEELDVEAEESKVWTLLFRLSISSIHVAVGQDYQDDSQQSQHTSTWKGPEIIFYSQLRIQFNALSR